MATYATVWPMFRINEPWLKRLLGVAEIVLLEISAPAITKELTSTVLPSFQPPTHTRASSVATSSVAAMGK